MSERLSRGGEQDFKAPETEKLKQPGRREFLKLAGLTAAGLAAETVGFRTEARAQGQTVSLKGMQSREVRERVREFAVKVTGLSEPAASEIARELSVLLEAEARQLGREPRVGAPEFVLAFDVPAVSEKQSRLRREAAEEVGRQTNRIPSSPQVFDNSTYIGRKANEVIGVWARSRKQKSQKQAEQAIAPLEGEAVMPYRVTVGTDVRPGRVALYYKKDNQEIVPQELELATGVRVTTPDEAFKDQAGALQAFIARGLVRAVSGLERSVLSDAVRDHALHSSEVTEQSAKEAPRKRPRPE